MMMNINLTPQLEELVRQKGDSNPCYNCVRVVLWAFVGYERYLSSLCEEANLSTATHANIYRPFVQILHK